VILPNVVQETMFILKAIKANILNIYEHIMSKKRAKNHINILKAQIMFLFF